jgi:hypothetical protein
VKDFFPDRYNLVNSISVSEAKTELPHPSLMETHHQEDYPTNKYQKNNLTFKQSNKLPGQGQITQMYACK